MKRIFLIIALISFTNAWTQTARKAGFENRESKQQPRVARKDKVWTLTYIRQHGPTRTQIDAKRKTVKVSLLDPVVITNLYIALSTGVYHLTPLNNNQSLWERQMHDPYVYRGPDRLCRILSSGGGSGNDRQKVGPSRLYITTTDLMHWQVDGSLPLMKNIRMIQEHLVGKSGHPNGFVMNKQKSMYYSGHHHSRTHDAKKAGLGIVKPGPENNYTC